MAANRFRFRAWDTDNECMVFSNDTSGDYFWCFDENGSPEAYGICEPVSDDPEDNGFSERLAYPQQSTGLADANGVEIFEGDVVTGEWTSGEPNRIDWDGAGFVRRFADGDRYHNLEHCAMTVIGNIHQNPELISEVGQ